MIGISCYNTVKVNDIVEETMFWTEEVENELGRWEEEKQTLSEVETRESRELSSTDSTAVFFRSNPSWSRPTARPASRPGWRTNV